MIDVMLDFPPATPAKSGHGSGLARLRYDGWMAAARSAIEQALAGAPWHRVAVLVDLRPKLGASLAMAPEPILKAIDLASRQRLHPASISVAWADVPGCRVRIVPAEVQARAA